VSPFSLFTLADANEADPDIAARFPLFALASISATIVIFGFGVFNLSTGKPHLAGPGLATSALVAAIYLAARWSERPQYVFFIGILFVDGFLLFLVANSANDPTLIYWIFAIPLVSFLLLGRDMGIVSSFIALAGTLSLFLFGERLGLRTGPRFEAVPVVRFATAYLLAGSLSFYYEVLRERRAREALERQRALEEANERIGRLSVTDSVTGVNNRLYFDQTLPREIKRAIRYDVPLSMILCDIDHFKRVNDTYGHLVGDLVLREVATLLATNVRSELDWVARYGGEEFAVVLPFCAAKDASTICERVRGKVEALNVEAGSQVVKVTASFGVAEVSPEVMTLKALCEVSDRRLYAAKERGRNRVVAEG
jgi:diguanylate cyclase (GGDEF)-like protein